MIYIKANFYNDYEIDKQSSFYMFPDGTDVKEIEKIIANDFRKYCFETCDCNDDPHYSWEFVDINEFNKRE